MKYGRSKREIEREREIESDKKIEKEAMRGRLRKKER